MASPHEMDEAYFDCKRKKLSNANRTKLAYPVRGPVGNMVAAAVNDRATNQVVARPVEAVIKITVGEILEAHRTRRLRITPTRTASTRHCPITRLSTTAQLNP